MTRGLSGLLNMIEYHASTIKDISGLTRVYQASLMIVIRGAPIIIRHISNYQASLGVHKGASRMYDMG